MGGYSRLGVFVLIIAGIVAYLKTGSTLFEKVKISGMRLQMKSIDRSMQAYELKRRKYPNNFVAFIRKAFDETNGKDPALDPWDHQYNYVASSKGYILTSAGGDGKFGTEDDVSWIREGDKAGLVTGSSKFKGVASSSVKSQGKKVVDSGESPVMKDFQSLFSAKALGNGIEKEKTDKELLEFLEKYMETAYFE